MVNINKLNVKHILRNSCALGGLYVVTPSKTDLSDWNGRRACRWGSQANE
jgi:hypothetical protein